MPRAFSDADLLQWQTGEAIDTPTLAPSLTNPTAVGNAGIIVLGGANAFDPPEQWDPVAGSPESFPRASVLVRAGLPGGETSWTFSGVGGANTYAKWEIHEWRNISFCPLVAYDNEAMVIGPASVTLSAAQIGLGTNYTMAIAALGIIGGTNATSVWSGVSWSGGFAETSAQAFGTGMDVGSFQLRVARRYGTQGETGPWTTTATFVDGVQTQKIVYACLAVFRAENFVGEA